MPNRDDSILSFTVRVPTDDDWFPTADDGTVSVSAMAWKSTGHVGICVWGEDDFGLEKFEVMSNRDNKRLRKWKALCKEIQTWKKVSIADLREQGYVNA